jgi:hypothetical protein
VIVSLMGLICEVHCSDGLRWQDGGTDVEGIVRLLPRQSERLQHWCYYWEECIMHAVEMTLDGMTQTYQVS